MVELLHCHEGDQDGGYTIRQREPVHVKYELNQVHTRIVKVRLVNETHWELDENGLEVEVGSDIFERLRDGKRVALREIAPLQRVAV